MAATVLNAIIGDVENKIPNTSDSVTTTVLNTKISEVEIRQKTPDNSKYTTTQEFNKLTTKNFEVRLR